MTTPITTHSLFQVKAENDSEVRLPRSPVGERIWKAATRLGGCFAVGVVAVLVWWLVGKSGLVSTFYISTPLQVFRAIGTAFADGRLAENLWSTLEATAIGFVIGSFFGVIAGLGIGLLPKQLEAWLAPYITALNSLPRIALAPIFIVFFGLGITSKVAVSISLVFFVLLVNSRAGILNVDPDLNRLTQAMNLSRLQLFVKLLLPSALPSIFAGLTLGLSYSLLGVVSSEIIASKEGVGQLIQSYSGTFNMAGVYAVLVILALVAAVLNGLMEVIQRWLFRWRYV